MAKKCVLSASQSRNISCVCKALKSCEVRCIKPHEFYQKWCSIISADCETWWKPNLFLLAAAMFNISSWITTATLEAKKTLKIMRNSTELNVPPNSLVSALLFLLVPSQDQGYVSCPRQETNTAKLHHIWLRFSMFVLQKTAETSGHILFSRDILTYFGRSLPYVPCILP